YSGAAEAALTLQETSPSTEHHTILQQTIRAVQGFGRIFDCGQPFVYVFTAEVAWLDSKSRRAITLGKQGITSAQLFQMPYAEGLAHYYLGRHLPQNDRRRAEYLLQAEAIFQRLGAVYDLERTRQALSRPRN